MTDIQYLDFIQQDPEQFNKEKEDARQEYIKVHGQKKFYDLYKECKHNDMLSHRLNDFRLTEDEKQKLFDTGIIYKNLNTLTFVETYMALYNNDMPVMITSDSILYALHKLYDNFLEEIEYYFGVNAIFNICENILKNLYSVQETEENKTYLQSLEIMFYVPLMLLNNRDRILTQDEMVKLWKKIIDESYKKITSSITKPKFVSQQVIDNILKQIMDFTDITLNLNQVSFEMNGTSFKPRGHYTKTEILQKYFKAFTWLSSLTINFKEKDTKEIYDNKLLLTILLHKVASCEMENIIKFEKFIEKIIGAPDSYTMSSFEELVKHTKDMTFDEIIEKKQNLCDSVILTKKSNLTNFGDMYDNLSEHSFGIIGKGLSYDHLLINELIDKKNKNRKYPSVFDITYALFQNESTIKQVKDRMENIYNSGRDGINYEDHINELKKKYENVFDKESNSLYEQELKILKSLTQDKIEDHPFNQDYWGFKQAQTQIAHYAELRHDNVLYAKENFGGGACCRHADLIIEPVPTFWKEIMILVDMLQDVVSMFGTENTSTRWTIRAFKSNIPKIIEYLENQMNNREQPQKLSEYLRGIINEFDGSGGRAYMGWYPKLFTREKDFLDFKPEVSSIFTGVPDLRDNGGIVHLGTGEVQIMYILVKNKTTNEQKIFLGPVYSAYEIITDYNTRYNDDEWLNEYKKNNKLDFF